MKIFNQALSHQPGEAVLTIPFTQGQPDDSLANIQKGELRENAFNFKVTLNTLDRACADWAKHKTGFIKIDVEGHELEVLQGASALIAKDKPALLVEIEQRHHKADVKFLIEDFCNKNNYRAYYFLPARHELVSFETEPVIHQNMKDFGTVNYVNNFFFFDVENFAEVVIDKINFEIEYAREK